MKGGTRKRGKTWSYYFDLGKVDGKRQKKEKGGFATKKEAEAALTEALNEYNNAGLVFTPSEVTLSDYLDYWMENYCYVNCKSNTIRSYSQIIANHIKPELGKYRLKSITAAVVQKWLNDLKAEGYSKGSIALYRDTLSCALTYAVNPLQYIQFNPCIQVKLPKFETPKKETRYVLSVSDFQKITEHFDVSTPHYIPLMIGFYTGMRINEVFALTWDDIDFNNRTISVNKTLIREQAPAKNDSPWFFNSPKTISSNRVIKFGDTLYRVLKEAKKQKNIHRMKGGQDFIENYIEETINKNGDVVNHLIPHKRSEGCSFPLADMVCIRDTGKFFPADTMTHDCTRYTKQEGIKFNFHSLRHTHATMLIENGATLKAVQERLGHANVTITMSIYTHNTESQIEETVGIFENLTQKTS
ncbi:site-specific integrase [Faecalicatena orotica]|uniref:Site-specific recombinase XerD n=1 Tax=Faecalicatena orotica TaxID=1544 RepID=A0A2Y9BDK4_9FIRM|nr:site-specific integrase [Faecalicatena orotica]PWJ29519.1 site-specific recombinase XerD [Faecalicatena orotica]SSA55974.1 Site-specific recombinase XerD [Faecalicatena orotica]